MKEAFEKRKNRTRFHLRKKANGRLRLSVFRSNRYIYAQVIDDSKSSTIVSASSLEKAISTKFKCLNKECAAEVGRVIGERAKSANVKEVIFDRGGYIYHGKIKALADAVRKQGVKF